MVTPAILVVDDEPGILNALERILVRENYLVRTAQDGTSARAAINEGPLDLILSDINMSEMSGFDLVRYAREKQPDTAIMLMTGGPSLQSAIDALDIGVARYLMKPFSTEQIVEAARYGTTLTRTNRARREAADLADGIHAGRRRREALRDQLSSAIGTLWMAYQPIVCCEKRETIAFEALVRSRHATLQRPDHLLDAAAELQLEHMLGRAIRAACARLPDSYPSNADLFVNIQASELLDSELYSPDAPLSRIASRVVLEVTERAALTHVDDIAARIDRLRDLGYRVAIDDLGAGFSGLTSFALLKPDIVKLDMSLVRGIEQHRTNLSVVRAMFGLTRDLNTTMVCEGVETNPELTTLRGLGCDIFQGYFFAKPGPDPRVISWDSLSIS